jgi:hypothetical protein
LLGQQSEGLALVALCFSDVGIQAIPVLCYEETEKILKGLCNEIEFKYFDKNGYF